MNLLISKCLEEEDIIKLALFPSHLLSDSEKEILKWIFTFKRRYDSLPSVSRLETEFPVFVELKTEYLLDDVYDTTVTRRQKEFFITRTNALSIKLRSGTKLDIVKELRDLLQEISVTDRAFVEYSTFEREFYFRSGRTKTGLRIIDAVIGGICNGDFMLIVGRLGTGKSSLATWLAHQWWLKGKHILFVSKEMLPADIFSRLDGMVAYFNPLEIRKEEDIIHKLDAVKHLIKSPSVGKIYIPSRVISSPSQVYEIIKALAVDIAIVDGVHLMSTGDDFRRQRWENVAGVSNELKRTALDAQIPLIGISQLKRVGTKKEYDPEDIAYSDALGQDADFVLATYPLDRERGRYELQLIKNRFGPLIATIVRFNFETMQLIEESIGE